MTRRARRVAGGATIAVGVSALVLTSTALQAQQSSGPMFTADMAGFIRVIAIMVGTVLLPLGGLNVYWLKSRSDSRIQEVKTSIEKDMEALRLEHARDLATLRSEISGFRGELNGFGGRVAGVERGIAGCSERVTGLNDVLSTDRQEIMQAIYTGGEQQIRAVHEVELKVAGVSSRNDLGPCLTEFGKSIEKLSTVIASGNKELVGVVLEALRRNGS